MSAERESQREGDACSPPERQSQVDCLLLNVLLVEDEVDIAHTIREGLSPLGFVVEHARDIRSGSSQLSQKSFDAVILDLTLPDGDGLTLASQIRTAGCETPLLMLTARDSVTDRLAGFEHGADDYLGKPFDVNELAARLRAMIRRAIKGERHILRYADLELDLVKRRARRRPGLEVVLSDREAELLALLIRRADETLTREQILAELWGQEVDDTSNLVNVYINLLRNKIEAPTFPLLIHTVRGVGYLFSSRDPTELAR